MSRSTSRRWRRGSAGLIAVVMAVGVSVVAAAGGAGASVRSAKIDKNGVLKFGANIADQGGEFFWPGHGPSQPLARGWMDQIYDVMIRPTADGKGAPGLATKWETPDATTVNLTLREGVKFADGATFNAAAVKTAWEDVIKTNPYGLAAEIKAITAIETPSEYQVNVKLNAPQAEVLLSKELQSAYWLGVPSPAALAAGTLNTKPVGAGPYVLDQYQKGALITLKRNPTYYNPKSQLLGEIQFINTATGAPSVAALQAGSVNLIRDVPYDSIDAIDGTKGLETQPIASPDFRSVNLCSSKAPFNTKEARQAVAYALDREAINQAAFQGVATATQNFLPVTSPFYNKKFNNYYKYDPKKAKELLAKAGVAPGTTVSVIASNISPYPAMAEVVQAQLKAVGLNTSTLISSNLPTDVSNQVPQMTMMLGAPGYFGIQFGPSPSTTLNQCGFTTPELQKALSDGQNPSLPAAERQKAWDRFIEINLDEAVVNPVVNYPLVIAHSDKVGGITVSNSVGGPTLFGAYVTK